MVMEMEVQDVPEISRVATMATEVFVYSDPALAAEIHRLQRQFETAQATIWRQENRLSQLETLSGRRRFFGVFDRFAPVLSVAARKAGLFPHTDSGMAG